MKEIVTRLHENRQVALAKSILESNGYDVRLKEDSKQLTRGYIHQDGAWHDYEELDFLKGNTMYKFLNGIRYSINKGHGDEYKITIWDTSVKWPEGVTSVKKNFDSMKAAMSYVDSITKGSSSNPRKSNTSEVSTTSSWEPVDSSDYRVSGIKKNGYEMYTQVVDISDMDAEERGYYGISPDDTQAYTVLCYDTPNHEDWIEGLCDKVFTTEEKAKVAAERYINNN